ncbi:MAG: hypothetical protein ACTIOL_11430 [Enterococcus sp.]
MRLLKKNFTKIGFLILLLGSMGISQEAQAAPPPVDFKKELALDFDMRLQDGTAYNDAIVLVDIEWSCSIIITSYSKSLFKRKSVGVDFNR